MRRWITGLGAAGALMVAFLFLTGADVIRRGVATVYNLMYRCTGTGCVSRPIASKLSDRVSVFDYKGNDGLPPQCDGAHDDSSAIQAAIDNSAGKAIYFPRCTLDYYLTTSLNIPNGTVLRGDGMYSTRLAFNNTNGLVFANGAGYIDISGLEVALTVRYTTTPNALSGITINGTSGTHAQFIRLEDVYLDGFGTGITAAYLWDSNLYNVRTNFGHIGMQASGLSVDVFMNGGQFSCDATAGSKGIYLSDATQTKQGWRMATMLIDACEIGIHGIAFNASEIDDSTLDHITSQGIRLEAGNANLPSTDLKIHDNYIALSGAASVAGIALLNAQPFLSGPHGNSIHHNSIYVYTGGSLSYGILVSGTQEHNNTIDYNRIAVATGGAITSDGIAVQAGTPSDNAVTNNHCISANGAAFTCTAFNVPVTEYGNVGSLNRRESTLGAAPATGTYALGDFAFNTNPGTAQSIIGWLNVTAGTPGTWLPQIAASSAGSITLSSGTPSTGTATVASGAKCVCTNATTQANPIKCAVASTTLTATGPNTVTDSVTYACF